MNILFSLTDISIGGAQVFVLRLASELKKRGHSVLVYNHGPEWSNEGLVNAFKYDVPIISYQKNKILRALIWKLNGLIKKITPAVNFRDNLNKRKYNQTIKKNRIELINSQMFKADLLTNSVKKENSFKFILTTHGEYELYRETNSNLYNPKVYKEIIESVDGIIYTTERNFLEIKQFCKSDTPVKKLYVGFTPNGIPESKIDPLSLGIKENDVVLGQVSRGIPEKGWEELIDIFKRIKETTNNKRIHLVLIGTGEYLKNLVEKKSVLDVHLIQLDKDPMQYFNWIKRFDIGILLSRFKGESVPNVVIEYLYNSKPVLATNIGEIPTMITGKSGLAGEIVEFSDTGINKEHAYNILNKWLSDPTHLQEHKKNTKSAFEKFSLEEVADRYEEFFMEVINKK